MSILEVESLTTYYKLRKGMVKACENISFSLEKGEGLGLVGESGCGKTTAALSLIRLLPENGEIMGGSININGRDIAGYTEEEMRQIRMKEISIIFQGAMNALNPVRTVGTQIVEAIKVHYNHLSDKECWERTGDLFEKVEIDRERVRDYPHEFSGGMRQRVMIAMALSCDPFVVIGDEPTTGLDVMVQAQVLQLLEDLRKEQGLGLLLISHDLACVGETCDKIVVMYAGHIVEYAPTDILFKQPLHPYTKSLMKAIPSIGQKRELIPPIPGSPPDLINPPAGCRFFARCPEAVAECERKKPVLVSVTEDHHCACLLVDSKVSDTSG